ncbi:thiol-disulfide oxidoreductase DCC family protein [Streptomyces filamentosus]|uniref:thiol-disulfide oxidoreductase DCC family protein n=1 Tax=Streptomyces filamentosus TaxID=67294 RepID=UPI003324D095
MRSRPVLVYDGDCGFCTTAAAFAERRVRPHCEIVPWQFTDLDALGVTPERAAYEVLWVTPSGAVDGGARAVAKALLSAGGFWTPVGAVLLLPGVRWGARGVYRLIAAHRHRLPGGTPACSLPPPPRVTETTVSVRPDNDTSR